MVEHVLSIPFNRRWITGTVSGASALTRPADTAIYAAGDEISNSTTAGSAVPFVFAGATNTPGGLFRMLAISVSTTGNINIVSRANFYSASPTMVGDNAVAGKTADRASFLGSFVVTAAINGTGAEEMYAYASGLTGLSLPLICASGSTTIYGVLTAAAQTPASGQVIAVRILVDQGV